MSWKTRVPFLHVLSVCPCLLNYRDEKLMEGFATFSHTKKRVGITNCNQLKRISVISIVGPAHIIRYIFHHISRCVISCCLLWRSCYHFVVYSRLQARHVRRQPPQVVEAQKILQAQKVACVMLPSTVKRLDLEGAVF